jgi:membrane protein DedA with SNARE-associated domain
VHFLETYGYLAIFLLALVEAICIPFPSEVTFGYPAALAAQGHDGFHLWSVIVVGVAGEICGSMIAYVIGDRGGRPAVDRWGKYVLLSHRDLDRAHGFLEKRGAPAVAIGRMLPVLRAFVSLVAGIAEMPFGRFVIATSIGTAIYGTAVASVGYALGANWHRIVKGFTLAGVAVAVVVAGVVALGIYHRWRQLRHEREQLAQGQAQQQPQQQRADARDLDA